MMKIHYRDHFSRHITSMYKLDTIVKAIKKKKINKAVVEKV